MDGLKRAEQIRQLDQHKREYEQANTELTVQCLALARDDTRPEQLRGVIDAAEKLVEICQHKLSRTDPMEVLFWLHRRVEGEVIKPQRDAVYKAICKRVLENIEQRVCQLHAQQGLTLPQAAIS